jgi:hypothetical protein
LNVVMVFFVSSCFRVRLWFDSARSSLRRVTCCWPPPRGFVALGVVKMLLAQQQLRSEHHRGSNLYETYDSSSVSSVSSVVESLILQGR